MKITSLTNGPFLVEGATELVDQNGDAYALASPLKFALCRCGGSAKKPFCDGTHKTNGFQCAPQSGLEPARAEVALSNWEGEGGGPTQHG